MKRGSIALVALLLASSAAGQTADTTNGWNAPRALRLVERARARREQPRGDSALRSYSARASGHVYFYLDRQDSDEQTLVRVDQVALELYWAAPNLTKQRIVGLRDVDRLPNKMYYHLDHLTVVQNGFGDVIRVGDGDEVRDVRHPASPGAESMYDYRVADSLTLSFPPHPPVRVYQVQVRPRQADRPAFVGSMYIDQATADVVRLTFTFTPSSYVDRRLDYINIALDNGLWNGNYWLPNEQYVEIRRQIPELDFAAGTVIKGRLRVYGYQFNQPFPGDFFFGRPVEAASPEERRAYPFEESIYAGLAREGLARPPQVEELRAQAAALVGRRKLSGLPSLRLNLPSVSSAVRYNETEGVYLGGGVIHTPRSKPELRLEAGLGFAFKPERPSLSLRLSSEGERTLFTRLFYRDLRDLGFRPGVPLGLNTFSALVLGADYLQPYFAHGVAVGVASGPGNERRNTLQLGYERHALDFPTASDNDSWWLARADIVRTVVRGLAIALELNGSMELGYHDSAAAEGATSGTYLRPVAELHLGHRPASRATTADLRLSAGTLIGAVGTQKVFFLGGVGTIPGHPYRGMVGNSFVLAEAEVTRAVWEPWLRLRAVAAAGRTWLSVAPEARSTLPAPTYEQAGSVGAGIGVLWDVLRFDLIKGKGRPRLYFSVKPDLRDLL